MLSFLILPTLLYFCQCYLPSPVPPTTALNPPSGSNITISNDFVYHIPETPYDMVIQTESPEVPPLPLERLQTLYARIFSRINEHIDRGEGRIIITNFRCRRGHIQLRWKTDGEDNVPINYTMFNKVILGLESIHADPNRAPVMGIYRRPINFFVEEWYRGEQLLHGEGEVLWVDITGSEEGGDSLSINGSYVNSSVVDS